MDFDRTESIVLYTCTVLFIFIVLLVLYKLFSMTFRKLCNNWTFTAKFPFFVRSPQLSEEQRVRDLLDRPSVRHILASRARTAEQSTRSADLPPPAATAMPFHKPEDEFFPPPPSYESIDPYQAYGPPPPYEESRPPS